MKRTMFRLSETIRVFAALALVLGATCVGNAEDVTPPASGDAVEINIHEDSTLTVSDDVEYGTLTVTGSGKLTLAGTGRITASSVAVANGVTLVNGGQLNSAPVSVGANGVFEIAAPMTWTNAISGEGGVRVSANEVVFAKQNTFTGGFTVASGGRARTTVEATVGGGFGGTMQYVSSVDRRYYSNVTVKSGGAVDMTHQHWLSCCYLFLAGTGINGCGAAYRSIGIDDPENHPHALTMTLTGDATVCADNAWGLIAPNYGSTDLNLDNHTLTITGTNNFLLCNTTINGTGTIEIADGMTLKTISFRATESIIAASAACRIKSGGRLYVDQAVTFKNVVCEAGGIIKFGNGDSKVLKASNALELPSDGYVTIDISEMSDIEVGATKTLIQCSSVTADTDISSLRASNINYRPKAMAGKIVVERLSSLPDDLVWSGGRWNVDSAEDMQRYSEATITLSEGSNTVELPGDVSFDRVTVSADTATSVSFSSHTATVGELVLGENVTFVNNGLLNSAPVSVAANAVFEIAAPMTWTHTISGEGGVRVSTNEVVFAKQNTFTGGLTVAPGGRASTTVPATVGGCFGGETSWVSSVSKYRFYANVTVESGGAVDMVHNHWLSCCNLFLVGTGIEGCGAAYRSGGISDAENQPHAKSITLTDDATVCADNAWGLIAPSFKKTELKLSEHTLTITGASNFLLCNTTIGGTGTIEIADGATLKIIKSGTVASSAACRIKGGGRFYTKQGTTTFANVACEAGSTMVFEDSGSLKVTGALELPSDGYATLDISAVHVAADAMRTLIQCDSVTTDTDISRLRVTGKANCQLKAVAGGIVVEHAPNVLTWSNGRWNYATLEEMQNFSEATVVLSEGENVVEMPGDLSFEEITVSAAAAGYASFSNGTVTVNELFLEENVTFVNNDNLAADAILMSTNSTFTVAQSTAYLGAIMGDGTVTVADGGILEVTNTTSVAEALQLQSGATLKIAAEIDDDVTNAIPVAVWSLALPGEGFATIDIADIPDLVSGVTQTLIACPGIAADMDISHLRVAGKSDCYLVAVEGVGIAVEYVPSLVWSDGSWNTMSLATMGLFSEATIVLSEGTNEVAILGERTFDRVTVSAAAPGTLLFSGSMAEIGELALGANVTYVHTGAVSNNVVYVRSGAGIASESDGLVANAVSLAMGTTVYRGAKTVNAETISVSTGDVVPMSSAPRLRGNGGESTVLIRNTTGEDPSGLWRVVGGRWSEPRPDADVFVFEPELPQDAGDRVVADDGLYFARASFTASTGEVSAHESAQDAADAAKGKGGKVTVLAGGESISLGAGWFSTGASIIVPVGVVGVTVTVAGIVIGGKDSGDDGSKQYDEEEEARAEVVETGKKYSSLALAKSHMGEEPCTFRLLAESRDSIHLATASEESGQTLLLNNWPYSGTVTGASANLAAGASVKSYYAILSAAKSAWTSGDTINLLSDGERYSVPNGKTLVLDGEKTYAVAKPFDLNGTLTVGGCTFTASAGITINAGTLKAAKANCTLIGSGTEVTLREGGVKVDTDGYSADIAAALTVAGGLQNKPVILKAGLANLRLSGGVVGDSVITIQSGCGKVFAPASSDCEPGDYTQISEQDAEWATFENGIAVANLVKADGSSTAYSSMNAVGAAAQLNPTYRYIEVLVNNQTLRCLPTMGVIRVKYDNTVFVFKVQSIAQDWTFDEVYGVVYSVFTPVHKATDYVWNGGEDGDWEAITNWKYNLALDYDLPIATRIPDTNDTVIIRADGMPEAGWSACIGSSGGACKEIKVEEGGRLTLSYESLGCDITKTDLGVIVVTNAWTNGTPTITVKENGGTVTIPKSAAYTLGENTIVVASTDETITLGFGVASADPYAPWAAENGITGAWDEADADGIYNVFRYVFDKATGKFTIIDISVNAEGNVVITMAPVVNPEGFSVSVVETSDVAGDNVTDEREITSSPNTATFEKSDSSRFYRLKAVKQD